MSVRHTQIVRSGIRSSLFYTLNNYNHNERKQNKKYIGVIADENYNVMHTVV